MSMPVLKKTQKIITKHYLKREKYFTNVLQSSQEDNLLKLLTFNTSLKVKSRENLGMALIRIHTIYTP